MVDYKTVDPDLAKIGLAYRYPDDPARVMACLTALALTQDDLPIEVIARAFDGRTSSVDRMRREAVAAAAEAASIKAEFRIVPYKWLAKMQGGGRSATKARRIGLTAPLPFASIADMRDAFIARRAPIGMDVLGRTGLAAVRAALGIGPPVKALRVSNSATTIRAAIAVVNRNLSDPLVQQALAKWRALS